MVAGCKSSLIWVDAVLSDPDFYYYLSVNKDYLFDLLDISAEANAVFKALFEVNIKK